MWVCGFGFLRGVRERVRVCVCGWLCGCACACACACVILGVCVVCGSVGARVCVGLGAAFFFEK